MSENALVKARDPVTRGLGLTAVLLALATIAVSILGIFQPEAFGHLTGPTIYLSALMVALLALAHTRARRLARDADQR